MNRTFGKDAFEYVEGHFNKKMPEIKCEISRLEWAMTYWVYWNKIVEKNAIWRYKVEDVGQPYFFKTFCEKIGIQYKKNYTIPKDVTQKMCHFKKDRRKRNMKKIPVTWELFFQVNEKLAQNVVEQGRKYGYMIP